MRPRARASGPLHLLAALAAAGGAASPCLAQAAGSAAVADAPPPAADAAPPAADDAPERFALHAQATFVVQNSRPFAAAFSGANSLSPRGDTRETADATLYAGVRPWSGAELWANPEVDQGFGLADTLGVAGFPSGEAYKVGKASPYVRLQRLFFRQTIALGGAEEAVAADLNQLRGRRAARRLVLTVGKVSVGDLFDTNVYAHDPRGDFLNWTLIDGGAFDYAADAWGYTTGGAAELYLGRFAARAGLFNLSRVPNSTELEPGFRQYALIGEVEEDHRIAGHEGKLKLTVFVNHGNMALLADAIAAAAPGTGPDPAPVRRFASRAGASLNLEQALGGDLGLFARASLADGRYEAFEFTDVDRSVAGGLSLGGRSWGRAADRVGLGLVVNHASADLLRYLAAGGLGLLVGDGALPHPGDEAIAEGFYDLAIGPVRVTADVQAIGDPAYNRDRGPVVVLGLRLHAQY